MNLSEIMDLLEQTLREKEEVESVGRIDGEGNVLGVEMTDGDEFFLTVDVV